MKIDMTEMGKLAQGLVIKNIPFTVRELWGGLQIICEDWDVICHTGSYGHEQGLLETQGLYFENEPGEDVVGYLTAEEILAVL